MAYASEFIIALLVAVGCGALIGIERQIHGSPAGLRTHMLVCMGSAITCLVSVYSSQLGVVGDVFRIAAQVISGIGFLGAGMIVFRHYSIIGLTTAAGIWTTAIIGLLAGYGFYLCAFIASAAVLIINTAILALEFEFRQVKVFYIELDDMHFTNTFMAKLQRETDYYYYKITQSKTATPGHIGVIIKIKKYKPADLDYLLSIDHVVFASED